MGQERPLDAEKEDELRWRWEPEERGDRRKAKSRPVGSLYEQRVWWWYLEDRSTARRRRGPGRARRPEGRPEVRGEYQSRSRKDGRLGDPSREAWYPIGGQDDTGNTVWLYEAEKTPAEGGAARP